MREIAANRGRQMREQAMATAKKRKEEFIGARVPKELRDKVIQRAKDEGVSVSILVRRVLEQAFNDSDYVSATINNQQSRQDDKALLKKKFSNVLGWETIFLNTQINCACCDKQMHEGDAATVGISLNGGAPIVVCNQCKESI